MAGQFDPYYQWLSIAPEEQPPHFYRLLGVRPLEENFGVIETAADRQMLHLRTFQTGQHGELSQKLLNEISTAKVTLLDPAKKSAYDAELRSKLTAAPPAETRQLARESPLPKATPLSVARPLPATPVGASAPLPSVASAVRGGARRKSSAVITLALVGVALLFVAAAGAIGWSMFGGEPHADSASVSPPATLDGTSDIAAPPVVPPVTPPRNDERPPDGEAPPVDVPSSVDLAPLDEPLDDEKLPAVSVDEPAPPQKLALPDKAARDAQRAEIAEVFPVGKSRSPAEKVELAAQLLRTADDSQHDPAALFALVNLAREQAAEAGDVALALAAADRLAATFDIDADAVRLSALQQASRAALLPPARRALAVAGVELVERLVLADNFDDADALCDRLVAVARPLRDNELTKSIVERRKAIGDLRARYQTAAAALAKLKTSPDDAEAHLAAGRYLAIVKQDWPSGLAHLARGSDAALKKLAALELQPERTTAQTLALGDGWWDVAAAGGDHQHALELRAVDRYRAVLPQLSSGLDRVRVEQRLAEASYIDALPRDAVLLLTFEEHSLVQRSGVTLARDYSGWDNHAQLAGAKLGEGVAGKGLVIANAGEHAICANSRSLQLAYAFTVAAWIKASSPPQGSGDIVSKDDWNGGPPHGLVLRMFPNGVLDVNIGDGTSWLPASSPAAVDASGWMHVAGTFDTRTLKLYHNGKLISTTRLATLMSPSTYPLTIGRGSFDTNRAFLGTIDEVALFARSLRADEVRQLYEAGARGLRLAN